MGLSLSAGAEMPGFPAAHPRSDAAVLAAGHADQAAAAADVPALLQFHEQTIRRAASQPGGDAPIPVPGYPVQGVALPKALAQTGRVDEWRDHVLRESAAAAYERGPEIFASAEGAEATRATITALRDDLLAEHLAMTPDQVTQGIKC